MELDSFKTILLRKADGNQKLLHALSDLEEDALVDSVIEALEKMATAGSGRKAPAPVQSFGQSLTSTDLNQLRDALGHHVSHYKAALKAHHAAPEGTPEKAKMRQVADQHLNHLIPLMHLTARAAKHSNGKLHIAHAPLAPWETNYTKLDRREDGMKKQTDDKLLGARTSRSGSIDRHHPNYHYLEMPPHPGHAMNAKMPHAGGYPWEEIQVGSPDKIDAKQAYLHIEDIPNKTDYVPHEFDSHPIRAVQDISQAHLSDAAQDKYIEDVKNWPDSEHHKKWMDRHREAYKADRAAYQARGQKKSPHTYEGIPLQPHQPHVHKWPVVPKMKDAEAAAAAKAAQASAPQAAAPAAPAAPVTAQAPTVRPSKPPIDVSLLPASLRKLVPTEAAKQPAAQPQGGSGSPPIDVSKLPASLRRLVPSGRELQQEQKKRVRADIPDQPSAQPNDQQRLERLLQQPELTPETRQAVQQELNRLKPQAAQAQPAQAQQTAHPLESAAQAVQMIPEEHRGKVIAGIPGLAEYLASKKGGQ